MDPRENLAIILPLASFTISCSAIPCMSSKTVTAVDNNTLLLYLGANTGRMLFTLLLTYMVSFGTVELGPYPIVFVKCSSTFSLSISYCSGFALYSAGVIVSKLLGWIAMAFLPIRLIRLS